LDLFFAYLAGLLTLINPCVLPVLPIVLASALQAGRAGPLILALGMALSFVTLGLGLTIFGRAIGLSPDTMARAGAVAMMAFGVVMLVPRLQAGFATVTAGLSTRADRQVDGLEHGQMTGQFLGGVLLGAVWVPCVGPTLGGAIALASTGESILWAAAIMAMFALGIGTIIVTLGYGAQQAIRARRDWLRALATRARPAMGLLFLLTGAVLFFDLQRIPELWLIENLPYWLQDLSVRY
jgi:cytochrome c-type biogenesis protein